MAICFFSCPSVSFAFCKQTGRHYRSSTLRLSLSLCLPACQHPEQGILCCVLVADCFMALGLQHQHQHQQQHHGRMHQLTGVICGYEHNFSNASHLALSLSVQGQRQLCLRWQQRSFVVGYERHLLTTLPCPSLLIDCRAAIWLHYFYYPFLHYPNGMPCLFACHGNLSSSLNLFTRTVFQSEKVPPSTGYCGKVERWQRKR